MKEVVKIVPGECDTYPVVKIVPGECDTYPVVKIVGHLMKHNGV